MRSARAARLAALGLSPWWSQRLDRRLPHEVVDVAAWWQEQYTGRRTASVRDLRIIALLLRGDRVAQVADRVGVSGQTVRSRFDLVAPELVALSGIDWAWAAQRAPDPRRALLRLGLDGPAPIAQPESNPFPLRTDQVASAWSAGADSDTLAAGAGLDSGTAFRRAARADPDALTPARYFTVDVARAAGLSGASVVNLITSGSFPVADGWDGGRRWWWRDTVTAWIAARDACPVCGAAVANLGAHRVIHGRADR